METPSSRGRATERAGTGHLESRSGLEGGSRLISALALGGLFALVVIPLVIWHRMIGDILASFHWSLTYALSELSPWFLLLAGVAFLVPVAISVGRDPESRLYPRARRAYIAWGTVVYLLGIILAVEVAEVWHYAH